MNAPGKHVAELVQRQRRFMGDDRLRDISPVSAPEREPD